MQIQLQISDNILTFQLYPNGTYFNRIAGIYTFFIIPPAAEALEAPLVEVLEARHGEPVEPRYSEQACTERSRSITHLPAPITQPYSILYLGITNNFQKRLNQHHKIIQAIELGMTHIGILKISSGRKRKNIERKLLQTYNPPLNQTWLNHTLSP